MSTAASLVIPTSNRKSELREVLHSAQRQTLPLEIIVMDDGSTDGTAEMVLNEFPNVGFHREFANRGPAFLRNRGVHKARHNIVFSLDDDTMLPSPRTVEQTLTEFDHPRVGGIGIPYRNVRQDDLVRQRAPAEDDIYVAHAFVGAAHAIRRDIFLQTGGYREHFYYMGEEGDFCLRLLQNGYVVRLGRAQPIDHLESAQRNSALADRSGRRNDILFAWHNAPSGILPLHLLATSFNGLRTGIATGHPFRMLQGTLFGLAECCSRWGQRHPVPRKIYELHRRLKKGGPLRLSEIEGLLPPIPDASVKPDHDSVRAKESCP